MSQHPDHPTLDPEVLAGLRELETDDDPGLFSELVELFLTDTPPRLRALEHALGCGDSKALEEVAHSLKSSCGNLGASALAELCKDLEALGREQRLHDAPTLVQRTGEEFRRVEAALRAELG